MMTIYKWENGGLKETSEFASSCWINLVDPTTTELEAVLTHSGVPRDFLTDPLDLRLMFPLLFLFAPTFFCLKDFQLLAFIIVYVGYSGGHIQILLIHVQCLRYSIGLHA